MKTGFSIISLLVLLLGSCKETWPDEFVAVNLVGYTGDELKKALIVNASADSFEVVRLDSQKVVYRGATGEIRAGDEATGDVVTLADFSEVREPGLYRIHTIAERPVRSETFRVGPDLYNNVTETILKSYYYHRCGVEVNRGEEWSYAACHLEDAPFYGDTAKTKDVTGGWHDAGDYNKFTVNTAVSAALLLYLYEKRPALFPDGQLDIPESGNGIPDLLSEVKWALDWLLKMQDSDGSLFHKVSQKKWVGEFLPHTDPEVRYIFDFSTNGTAGFAAVASLGGRLMNEFDPVFATKLEQAAIRAWQFLENNPETLPEGGFRNPPDVFGGDYGDPDDRDERLWASIELYRLTGESRYMEYFNDNYRMLISSPIPPVSWKDVDSLVFYSYLAAVETENLHFTEKHLRSELENHLIQHAGNLLDQQQQNNYRNLLHPEEYYWGSNSVGLGYAFDLLQVYELTQESRYLQGALDQLHYILGRNPFGLSQATGVGEKSVQNPYHQLSWRGKFEEPVPGMLVGGANNYLHLGEEELSSYPAKNYEDRFKNYLVNEVAINFTAIMAYVSGYFIRSTESVAFNSE